MKTDNELIAEFMGFIPKKYHPDADSIIWCVDGLPVGVLKFDTSWDWLMPVVEKITNTKPMNQSWYDVDSFLLKANIKVVHERVVAFIKWYNSTSDNIE